MFVGPVVVCQNAGCKSVVRRSVKRILIVRAFHEVEVATAVKVFEADRLLHIADADIANAGHFAECNPQVGRSCDVIDVALTRRRCRDCGGHIRDIRVSLIHIDRIHKVKLGTPVDRLIHRSIGTQSSSTKVDGILIGEGTSPGVISGVILQEHRIQLYSAAYVKLEPFVFRRRFEAMIPLRGKCVGIFGLLVSLAVYRFVQLRHLTDDLVVGFADRIQIFT